MLWEYGNGGGRMMMHHHHLTRTSKLFFWSKNIGRIRIQRHRWKRWEMKDTRTYKGETELLTKYCSRFSLLICSTLQRPLRPRSTSSRYEPNRSHHRNANHHLDHRSLTLNCLSRPLFPSPDPSSWTSSAPAASPSPPFSLTPRPLSSARDAPPSCASLAVVRPD
jgi:hypothetical protein